MELVLLALCVIGVSFVLPIFLLAKFKKMSGQIVTLEQDVLALQVGVPEVPEVPEAAPVTAEPVTDKAPPKPARATSIPETIRKPKEPSVSSPPEAFVFKRELSDKITDWLQKNWFFAIAAVSLALAGVFLVQYGVENGLLSPARRVMASVMFGAILIGAGEYIRRKLGNDENGSFALLPSAFSGAGLVSMFAGVLSARMMYGLIGPEAAFVALILVGTLAVILGWFYGPLLAIIGVFGALSAPFLVGSESDAGHFLHLYFAGIAVVALGIDSVKRWAWLSALGLIGAYAAAGLLYVGDGNEAYFMAFALITALSATVIPVQMLVPRHDGSRITSIIQFRNSAARDFPEFPTRLTAGAFVASTFIIWWAYTGGATLFWYALGAVSILLIAAIVWMRHATALRDLAYFPALTGLAIIAFEGVDYGQTARLWNENANRSDMEFTSPILAILIGGALLASLLFAWRSYQNGPLRRFDAGVAALIAPLVAVIAEMAWSPDYVLGSANWALYLAVVAIVMTGLSTRFSRIETEDRTRTALFALSAISMLSFVLFTVVGSFALTLGLATQVAAAAWLGRQFRLPLMDRYVQAGILVVSWRLVVYPGLEWGFDAELWQVVVAHLGAIALLVGAYVIKRKDAPVGVIVMLESSIWSLSGVFVTLMLARYFEYLNGAALYLYTSMIGLVWLISAANQLYRIRPEAGLRRMRIVLASLYSLAGFVLVGASVFVFHPLNNGLGFGKISGPYVFDTLAVAYALPALLLAFVALRFTHVSRGIRKALGIVSAFLAAVYIGLEIRHWWHGEYIGGDGVFDGELYSYTVAMMLAAIILLVLAFIRQSSLLRKLALGAVALTVAKVYMLDASGLDGLLRVASFLVLGLVLAAMAWVNRILQNNEAKVD